MPLDAPMVCGLGGQPFPWQIYCAASPSAMSISPTLRPLARRIRTPARSCTPTCPRFPDGRHSEPARIRRAGGDQLMEAPLRPLAELPLRAHMPVRYVSGALKPTRRVSLPPTHIVSPSTTVMPPGENRLERTAFRRRRRAKERRQTRPFARTAPETPSLRRERRGRQLVGFEIWRLQGLAEGGVWVCCGPSRSRVIPAR